jgi:Ca-activated chloride channel homolog
MFEGFYFEFPKLAFLFFFFVACESLCKMRLPSIYFPQTGRFGDATLSASKLIWFLKWLGITMLVVAIMSPVKDMQISVKPQQGYDIALVLDASESMKAQGFDPDHPERNRFDAVKLIVNDFIQRRTSDNLGVITFGQYSFIASPLTYDRNILARVVDQLHIGMAGKMTALYEAMGQSVNLLKNATAASRIAILLTDGKNTIGRLPLDVAIDLAKKEKIRVYTIGIGGPGEYSAAVLKRIADETGGQAFGARNIAQLQQIYDEIDTLEKSEIETNQFSFKRYYYLYPLFLGVLSLLGFVYLRNKKGWV